MHRTAWIVFNAIMAITSLTAAVLLMIPVELKRQIGSNAVVVRMSWTSVLCKMPTPNVNVTEAEVIDYWKLPPTVRLSPLMISMGRCVVAITKWNRVNWMKASTDICYCSNEWWMFVFTLVGLASGLCSCTDVVTGLSAKEPTTAKKAINDDHRKYCNYLVRSVFVMAIIYFYTDEFTYTEYGRVFSSSYFEIPTMWYVAACSYGFGVCLYGCGAILQGCSNYYVFGLRGRRSRRDDQLPIRKWAKVGTAKMIKLKENEDEIQRGKWANEKFTMDPKSEIAAAPGVKNDHGKDRVMFGTAMIDEEANNGAIRDVVNAAADKELVDVGVVKEMIQEMKPAVEEAKVVEETNVPSPTPIPLGYVPVRKDQQADVTVVQDRKGENGKHDDH